MAATLGYEKMKYVMYKKDESKLLWQTAYVWLGDFNILHSQTYSTCGRVVVLLRGGSCSTIGTIHTFHSLAIHPVFQSLSKYIIASMLVEVWCII